MNNRAELRPIVTAGTLLGMGMGGFVDGILFHQLLQAHNMLSAKYPKVGVDPKTAVRNLEINMFWDGLFHAGTWALTAIGLALLWRALNRSTTYVPTKVFVGSLALGWGIFNLVEGVINHHLLQIHHVVETEDHVLFDIIFLASGVALIVVGWLTLRAVRRTAAPPLERGPESDYDNSVFG